MHCSHRMLCQMRYAHTTHIVIHMVGASWQGHQAVESMLNLTSKATSRRVHGGVAAVALHPSPLFPIFIFLDLNT